MGSQSMPSRVLHREGPEMKQALLLAAALVSVVASVGLPVQKEEPEPAVRGRPVSAWISSLEDADIDVRLSAASALVEIGEAGVPFLVQALHAADNEKQTRLLTALSGIGRSARSAAPAVTEMLSDDSAAVRMVAAAALVAIDCELQDRAWPTRLEALRSGSGEVSLAVTTVGYLGADAGPAVPGLIALLDSPDAGLRLEVINALWKIGPSAESASSALEAAALRGGREGESATTALRTILGEAAVPSLGCRKDRR